jgi:hypothetical protein
MRRTTGAEHLGRLRDWLAASDQWPGGLPVLTVPELFSRASGPRVVAMVGEALTDELDLDPAERRRGG